MTNQDMQAEALDRARSSASLTNYPAIRWFLEDMLAIAALSAFVASIAALCLAMAGA